jgi:hypothetical protein
MKNHFLILTVLLPAFCECKDPKTHDEGVEINGVVWATRNVDRPGTFAATPYDPGMLYQWNSKVGWSATDSLWSSDNDDKWVCRDRKGDEWAASTDPCPPGWRIPTRRQCELLVAYLGADAPKYHKHNTDSGINQWWSIDNLALILTNSRTSEGMLQKTRRFEYWSRDTEPIRQQNLTDSIRCIITFGLSPGSEGVAEDARVALQSKEKGACLKYRYYANWYDGTPIPQGPVVLRGFHSSEWCLPIRCVKN